MSREPEGSPAEERGETPAEERAEMAEARILVKGHTRSMPKGPMHDPVGRPHSERSA